jgi:Phage tail tube protein, GTA-gp10
MMAANRRRGEISAVFDGRDCRLCLTLGALAELEDAFGVGDLNALADRFSSGRLSARDMMEIIAAGLRGGGQSVSASELGAMSCEGGLAGFAKVAGELLEATFGVG